MIIPGLIMLSISTMDPCFPALRGMLTFFITDLSSSIGGCLGCQTEELCLQPDED